MTSVPEIARRLINGVWTTGVAEDPSGGGLPSGGSTGEVLTKESNADGDVGWEPGGGSQPGIRRTAAFLFTEPAGPHADMVATFDVPAKARVLDVVMLPLVVTFADTITLTMGDTANPTGYFNAAQIGPSGFYQPYNPLTTGAAGNDFDVLGNIGDGYLEAAYLGDGTFGSERPGIPYPAGDTITMTVAGIATGGGRRQLPSLDRLDRRDHARGVRVGPRIEHR